MRLQAAIESRKAAERKEDPDTGGEDQADRRKGQEDED